MKTIPVEKADHAEPGCSTGPVFHLFLSVVVSIVLTSCAVPVLPTGGPPDQDPPSLVSSDPENGSINQSVEQIRLQFDEALDERSAIGAISIIPEFIEPLDIRVRGDRIDIRLPARLRPNTTYILTVDTALRDAHNVGLNQPITLAFGTGPEINSGRLRGSVRNYQDGSATTGIDIFAFESDSTGRYAPDVPPDYRTQTDVQGNFSLSYLREGHYRIIALTDRNRNRMLDPGEKSAVGTLPLFVADSVGSPPAAPWVLAVLDTAPPHVDNAISISNELTGLRFSEEIVLHDTSTVNWQLIDSTSAAIRPIRYIYAETDSREVTLRHERLSEGTHILAGYGSVSDSSGNAMQIASLTFSPTSEPYDMISEFGGFEPDTLSGSEEGYLNVWPGLTPMLRFSAPFSEVWEIAVKDSAGTPLPFQLRTDNGTLFSFDGLDFSVPTVITVTGADTTHSRSYLNVDNSRVGELSGIVSTEALGKPVLVELIRDADGSLARKTRAASDGSFRFFGLPGGSRYSLRSFVDVNEDGKWNPGIVNPFVASEPIGWISVQELVRARWETVIPDTLHIPVAQVE